MTNSIAMKPAGAVERLGQMRSRRPSLGDRVAWRGWAGSLALHATLWLAVATLAASVAVDQREFLLRPDAFDMGHWQPLATGESVDSLFDGGSAESVEAVLAELESTECGADHPSVGYEDLACGAPDWVVSGGHLAPLGAGGDAGDRLAGKAFRGVDEIIAAIVKSTPDTGEDDLLGASWSSYISSGCGGYRLEVVFCIDASGSMGDCFAEVKTRVRQLIKVVTYLVPNSRIGITAYRDLKANGKKESYEWLVKYMPLQKCDKEGIDKLQRFLKELDASGGGDLSEAVDIGLKTTMEKAGWSPRARKVIILFGDAPPHVEKDGLAETCELCRKFKEAGGTVSCVDTRGDPAVMDEFKRIALVGGGEATLLDDERAVIKQLVVTVFGSHWVKELDAVCNTVAKGGETN